MSVAQKPIPSSSTTMRMFSSSWLRVTRTRLCVRMSNHVGQALLEDPEGSRSSITIQVQVNGRNGDLAANAISRGKLARLPFNGCRQAKVIQYTRSQSAA